MELSKGVVKLYSVVTHTPTRLLALPLFVAAKLPLRTPFRLNSPDDVRPDDVSRLSMPAAFVASAPGTFGSVVNVPCENGNELSASGPAQHPYSSMIAPEFLMSTPTASVAPGNTRGRKL